MTGPARYVCCNERRLRVVKKAQQLNGVEYVEVAPDGVTLFVRLLKPAAGLTADSVRIDGGERIPTVPVRWTAAADALPVGTDPALVAELDQLDHVLVVRTAETGDFSYYTLRIVTSPGDDSVPSTFDPLLASVRFAFRLDCDSGFDCRGQCRCHQPPGPRPDLDYLARDFPGLRRLLLDRISLLAPGWRERSPADLGVTLVEVLAYAGDRLAYEQDSAATEAFLGTARRRVSLRRHARLVDYRIHEGCSARVLLRLTVAGEGVKLPAGTRVFSRVPALPVLLRPDDEQTALTAGAVVFETVDIETLYASHDHFDLYTWGDTDCCLPAGAVRATLHGDHPDLKAGDILVFAELVSPTTGRDADADPLRRCAVRLTRVASGEDPSGGQFLDPPSATAVKVTEIEWDAADALPFPVCVSAEGVTGPVSAAWGNIVVADHGRTLPEEILGTAPAPSTWYAPAAGSACAQPDPRPVPARFRPRLQRGPLTRSVTVRPRTLATADPDPGVLAALGTHTASVALLNWLAGQGVVFHRPSVGVRGGDGEWSVSDGETVVRVRVTDEGKLAVLGRAVAATGVTATAPRDAVPQLWLRGQPPVGTAVPWEVRWDLLASTADDPHVVVESEHDGSAYLRFGDGGDAEEGVPGHGRRPEPGSVFTARYRVGNGRSGNVGAEVLAHIVAGASVTGVTNPLPAAGGYRPESADEVRRDAPEAFGVQERAVTPADWSEVATRHPRVQRAAATWRWTGSWHTVFLTVDRLGGSEVDAAFEADQRAHLERYRLAGYDLEVDGPRYVPLELRLHVCLQEGHLRSAVHQEVLTVVRGLFDPDHLTFAQPVYLSPVYAAVQAVPGVESVTASRFRRRHDPGISGLESGVLPMSRLEIARLDDDPNAPERGTFTLTLGGGR